MEKANVCWCCVLCMLPAVTLMLVAAYGFVIPVQVTVEAASLRRLALAAPAGNGTASSLAYDLSLAVALRNPSWAMSVRRTAPLDAELCFAGQPFAGARLAGAERDKIRPRRKEVYRVHAAAAESAPLELDGDAAAEFAGESAAGVFELELIVAVEIKYEAPVPRRSLRWSCPLKLSLSLSTATAAATFAKVECALALLDVATTK